MTKIQILGTGCSKCEKLTKNAQQAVKETGADCTVQKVTDIMEITNFGVMVTPALVIDGEVKSVGKVLSTDEIKKLIS
jgi:small redox-active disulfide protein 2